MPAATRWGIASAGLICSDFVTALQAAKTANDHEVVAVAARSLDKAQAFADKFGIPKAYAGYQALAADPNVEVVYVGVINPVHIEAVKIIAEGGKHILCEKPLGMNVKETKAIQAICREKGVFLMEAMWSCFQPAYLKLQSELKRGIIGDVKQSIVSFGFPIESERVTKKDLGGGSMLDLGVYTTFFSTLAMTGDTGERPTKITADGQLNPEGTDDSISATLTYPGGRTATMVTSTRAELANEAVIYGTKGKLVLEPYFWSSTSLVTPEETFKFPLPEAKPGHSFNFHNSAGLAYEADHVRECLLKGLKESPKMTFDRTLMMAEVMESVRKQAGVVYDQD